MTYNNFAYSLGGDVIEKVSGQSHGTFLAERIFNPFGLEDTTLGPVSGSNYASSYMALSNATPYHVKPPPLEDGKLLAAAGATKSTLNNLLKLYAAWLKAAHQQTAEKIDPSPFKLVPELWRRRIPVDDVSDYGLDWVVTELPAKAGLVGLNAGELEKMPVIAKDTGPRQMIYHQGAMNGATSAVYLLPESETVIVVLCNTLPLCDTPDWVAQLIIETILDCQDRNDFVTLADDTIKIALSHYPETQEQLDAEKKPGTPVLPLINYTGRYTNKMSNFFVDVHERAEGLHMTVQSFDSVYFDLYHYDHDTFAWDCDRDAETKRMIYPQAPIGWHKVSFQTDSEGNVTSLIWALDAAVPEGQEFTKIFPEKKGLI